MTEKWVARYILSILDDYGVAGIEGLFVQDRVITLNFPTQTFKITVEEVEGNVCLSGSSK